MTNAHADAIEAANEAWRDGVRAALREGKDIAICSMQAAITAYLDSMADAGWVMVRDVGEIAVGDADTLERMAGWNACRAAMLADPPPKR